MGHIFVLQVTEAAHDLAAPQLDSIPMATQLMAGEHEIGDSSSTSALGGSGAFASSSGPRGLSDWGLRLEAARPPCSAFSSERPLLYTEDADDDDDEGCDGFRAKGLGSDCCHLRPDSGHGHVKENKLSTPTQNSCGTSTLLPPPPSPTPFWAQPKRGVVFTDRGLVEVKGASKPVRMFIATAAVDDVRI